MAAWIAADVVQQWIGADLLSLGSADQLAQIASDAMRSYLERDLAMTTVSEFYDANGTNYVLLNYWPVRSIGAVYYLGQSVAPANPTGAQPQAYGWTLDTFVPRKLKIFGYGPLPRAAMAVRVVGLQAGYDVGVDPGSTPYALPGHVFQALRLTCQAIFTSQASDPNLTGESISGVFSGSFMPEGVSAIPRGAKDLVRNERRAAP